MARREDGANPPVVATGRVRFDKWLWAARFYRTRGLAAQAIEAGQARIAAGRVKPAHAVRAGDVVTIRRRGIVVAAVVTEVSDRRGPAAEAAKLYRETEASIAAREHEDLLRRQAASAEPHLPGRPTKRDRRRLEDFLNEP